MAANQGVSDIYWPHMPVLSSFATFSTFLHSAQFPDLAYHAVEQPNLPPEGEALEGMARSRCRRFGERASAFGGLSSFKRQSRQHERMVGKTPGAEQDESIKRIGLWHL